MNDEINRLKTKEKWLREEIRASRTSGLQLIQWGVTVLAALESSLYYARRDVTEHLSKLNALPLDGIISWPRWLLGTSFVTMVAIIFSSLVGYNRNRHVAYRKQLLAMNPSFSGIIEGQTGTSLHLMSHFLFFLFPLFDVFVRLSFYVANTLELHIPW